MSDGERAIRVRAIADRTVPDLASSLYELMTMTGARSALRLLLDAYPEPSQITSLPEDGRELLDKVIGKGRSLNIGFHVVRELADSLAALIEWENDFPQTMYRLKRECDSMFMGIPGEDPDYAV